MSSRGYNEALAIPSNHKDSSESSLRAFDKHFQTLNVGLLSVARNISTMHVKVGELETATKSANDLKHRVDTMEKTLTSHGKVLTDIHKMLADMARSHQDPPNTAPQFPPQFTTPARQEPQKSRAQLMLETQRAQQAALAQKNSANTPGLAVVQESQNPPVAPIVPVVSAAVPAIQESLPVPPVVNPKPADAVNEAVEALLKAANTPRDKTAEKSLDQILESLPNRLAEENENERSDSDENLEISESDENDEDAAEEEKPAVVKPVAKPVVKSPATVVKPIPTAAPAAKPTPVSRRIVTQKKK